MLRVEHLSKRFGGVLAVQEVSFCLQAGEILALIGPNGAGKSTCFNMLSGQIPVDYGRIVLEGRDIAGLNPSQIWRLGVGRTFQITETFASMTVRENIQMALISHHRRLMAFWPRATRMYREQAMSLLEQVGMADQAERSCSILAYGDLKRVELALALANDPKVLLMDEPTAGMAPAERIGLMELTVRLALERSLGVLFTEHDMDVVFSTANRIVVLECGRVIAAGNPWAVRSDRRVQEVYLGSGALYGDP